MEQVFNTFSLSSKVLSAVTVVGYLLQLLIPSSVNVFGLVTGNTVPFVWNLVTSAFIENALTNLIVTVSSILILTKIIEPVYGQNEYLKFLFLSITASGVTTFIFIMFLYYTMIVGGKSAADRAGDVLYYPICGFHGGIAALLVAVKQIIPDNDVTLLRAIHFRAKHLPALYLCAITLVALITGNIVKLVPFSWAGAYFAWFYLRFFRATPETGRKGDPSMDFRFASFFPDGAQPAIDTFCGGLASITGLKPSDNGDSLSSSLTPLMPPATDQDAARRRQRGAKALEERLGMKASARTSPSSSPIQPPPEDAV